MQVQQKKKKKKTTPRLLLVAVLWTSMEFVRNVLNSKVKFQSQEFRDSLGNYLHLPGTENKGSYPNPSYPKCLQWPKYSLLLTHNSTLRQKLKSPTSIPLTSQISHIPEATSAFKNQKGRGKKSHRNLIRMLRCYRRVLTDETFDKSSVSLQERRAPRSQTLPPLRFMNLPARGKSITPSRSKLLEVRRKARRAEIPPGWKYVCFM